MADEPMELDSDTMGSSQHPSLVDGHDDHLDDSMSGLLYVLVAGEVRELYKEYFLDPLTSAPANPAAG